MKNIDDLFDLVDSKLLELHEAPTKKYYKVFDFKTLLVILNDELVKNGYNEYYKKKASQIIAVFNDLCNTMVESCHYRDLSYDEVNQEVETEIETHNTITNQTETKIIKRAAGELSGYFSKKELPEEYYRPVTETCKLDYLLRECKKDYSSFYPAASRGYTGRLNDENDIITYIAIGGDIISKKDKFENYFSIDINFQWEYKISFETYVDQISKKRAVLEATNKEASIYNPPCLFTLNENKCVYLRTELIKNNFLPKDTNIDHFNYVFGGGMICPNDFAPLRWEAKKQVLNELIFLLTGKASIPRSIKRDAKKMFTINNNPIKDLSTPAKGQYSGDYKALETIINTINNTNLRSL